MVVPVIDKTPSLEATINPSTFSTFVPISNKGSLSNEEGKTLPKMSYPSSFGLAGIILPIVSPCLKLLKKFLSKKSIFPLSSI